MAADKGDGMKYDIWRCWVNARISYRATPHRSDDKLKPDNATAHLDTIEATGKRAAISKAIKAYRAVKTYKSFG